MPKAKFSVGDAVFVPSQQYDGEIVAERPSVGGADYLVRYVVEHGRKPYYETWWPASYLEKRIVDEH